MPPSLDETLINEAAPPGSLRYFALLYTPEEQCAFLAALYIIDNDIRTAARSPSHDVAHTRLHWWREEAHRLAAGTPQHPASRVLQELRSVPGLDFKLLHELLIAAEQDLACVTYDDAAELDAYERRSGGALAELSARILFAPDELPDSVRESVRLLGIAIRQTEIVRDIRQDAHDGRIYFALPALEKAHLATAELRQPAMSEEMRKFLLGSVKRIRSGLDAAVKTIATPERQRLRPLLVLASLHARLLDRLEREQNEIARRRIELKAFEKVWTAWRAARGAR